MYALMCFQNSFHWFMRWELYRRSFSGLYCIDIDPQIENDVTGDASTGSTARALLKHNLDQNIFGVEVLTKNFCWLHDKIE